MISVFNLFFDQTSKIQVRDIEGRFLSRELNKLPSKYYGQDLEADQERELLEKSTDLLREWVQN